MAALIQSLRKTLSHVPKSIPPHYSHHLFPHRSAPSGADHLRLERHAWQFECADVAELGCAHCDRRLLRVQPCDAVLTKRLLRLRRSANASIARTSTCRFPQEVRCHDHTLAAGKVRLKSNFAWTLGGSGHGHIRVHQSGGLVTPGDYFELIARQTSASPRTSRPTSSAGPPSRSWSNRDYQLSPERPPPSPRVIPKCLEDEVGAV
jgi:hypothetical protein